LLTMVQVLYLLEVFILAHYGPPSTESLASVVSCCLEQSPRDDQKYTVVRAFGKLLKSFLFTQFYSYCWVYCSNL